MAESESKYLQNRNTNETHQSEKQSTTVSTNRYCSKAKDLFGEETVHC